MEKYKKLIISQICAVMAIGAAILAILRHNQTNDWSEQMTLSFVLFAVVLFVLEIRLILDWVKSQKKAA